MRSISIHWDFCVMLKPYSLQMNATVGLWGAINLEIRGF